MPGFALRSPRRRAARLLATGAATLAALLGPRAAAGQPAVEWVTPYAPSGGGRVTLLLKNGTDPVRNVTLSWLTRDGGAVPFGAAPVAALPAGAQVAVTGTAPRQLAAHAGDSLLARVEFGAGTAAAPQSRFAWLPVGRAAGSPPLRVQVLGSAESLMEYETRRLLLQVTDTGEVAVRVDSVRTVWPGFIELKAVAVFGGSGRWPLELAPGESRVIAYDVRLGRGITPGQQTLVFDLPATWRAGGETVSGNALASTTLPVAILGESELLKLLALPSLLFVPGFLVLVVLGLLWRFEPATRWRPPWNLPFKPSEPEFWVLSITVSIVVWAAAMLLWKRNLLERYNASDVAYLWLWSLLAGVVAFALVSAGYQLFLRRSRSPMRVLRLLAGRKQTLALRRVKFRVGDQEGSAFLVHDAGPTAQTVLVAPPIRVRWGDLTPEERRRYETALAPRELWANDVADLLDEARRANKAELSWKQAHVIAWPTRIAKKDVSAWRDGRDLLIEVETDG
ncbi:MAG TPA: hypothetical protein VEX86_10675 [Longimicrobium sp.]|nr:hypothetical protein [Longimicrobium sp.]